MKKLLEAVAQQLMAFVLVCVWAVAYVGSVAFHFFSGYQAAYEIGPWWGLLILSTPPLGELFWIGRTIFKAGLVNAYIVWLLIEIIAWFAGFRLMAVYDRLYENR